jgi:hypothetical protein
MPKLADMLKHDNSSFTDLNDKRFQRHPTLGGHPNKNPFKLVGEKMGDSFKKQVDRLEQMEKRRRRIDRDLRQCIKSFKTDISSNRRGTLSEETKKGFTIEEDED